MKFDSTMYLLNAFKIYTNLDQKAIENCLRVLNGFTIYPNSIHYNEENETLSFIGSLPNSELEVFDAYITPSSISLRCGIKGRNDLSIRLKCSTQTFISNFAICIGTGVPYAGLYYFNSSAGKKDEKGRQRGLYSYFDYDTLSHLKYYANRERITLESLIDAAPTTINMLGYMPDNIAEAEIEPKSREERAKRINRKLRDMNYEVIQKMVEKVYTESTCTNEPISI